jgi:hypothetical protein
VDFAEEVMALTDGRGVTPCSIPRRRFHRQEPVRAGAVRSIPRDRQGRHLPNAKIGCSFSGTTSRTSSSISRNTCSKPALVARMFAELGERFAAGDYRAAPYTSFPITQAADAFRFMAQAKHVGKNVLRFDARADPIAFNTDDGRAFPADATYLITGGAGGWSRSRHGWLDTGPATSCS